MPAPWKAITLTALLLVATALAPAALADEVPARTLFEQVYERVERGDWSVVENLDPADQRALEDYVLWPELRAAYLRATLGRTDSSVVEAFLDQYGTLRPARSLRYRYALWLARNEKHDAFLDVYNSFYRGMEVARLDCEALASELALGRTRSLASRAKPLWMTPESQASQCDPVFDWLADGGHLTRNDYEARYRLAIDAREFARARWLGKSIDDSFVRNAEAWQRAAANPTDYVRANGGRASSPEEHERLAYAVERQTYADPVIALDLWSDIRDRLAVDEAERFRIDRHIALWTARDRLPGAAELLSALPAAAMDTEVLRWRARVALRDSQWGRLLLEIAELPPEEANREEWRYWQAVALGRTGRAVESRDLLEALAKERSYYGFLAADSLGRRYAFRDSPLEANEASLELLAQRTDLQRARELFFVGLESHGRAEWDAATRSMSRPEQEQAAILASRWGWHSRAIATASRAAHYDDLAIRYPLPYFDQFESSAEAASIPTTWAYGVARSESMFMRDVRSGAGAIGLMQLMPRTGRAVARDLALNYEGTVTLTNPAANIRLGTTYLGRMVERFDGNRVVATAAYNAGPNRVDEWLPITQPVDTRVWVENIPFNETRGYVRRVLAAETIFHWRMTGEMRRLSDFLEDVVPASAEVPVARLSEDAGETLLEK